MKRFFKITFLTLLLFIGINKVNAANCDDLVMYAQSDFAGHATGITLKYENQEGALGWRKYSYYNLKDGNGAAFSSYCRNPGRSAGKIKGAAQTEFKCQSTVSASIGESETRKAYNAGILAILENGYSTRSSGVAYLGDNEKEKVATGIALRSFEMFWSLNSNTEPSSSNCKSLHYLYGPELYYANKWLADSDIKPLIQSAVGSVRGAYSCATEVQSISQNNVEIKNIIDNEVKRLLILGLNAAIDYNNNGVASVSWTPVDETILETTRSDGQKYYTKEASYTFNIKNFKSSGAYVNLILDCPTCVSKGVNYTIYVNGNNLGTSLNKNLLDYVSNGTGKVNVKIVFTRNAYESECNSISYDLNIKYCDETIDTEAYDLLGTGCPANVTCQHFYMLYATDTVVERNVDSTIEVCDCDELEVLCSNGNSKACNIINEDYEGKCVNCATEINNSACTKDDSEIDIIEGHELDEDTCKRSNDTNVRYCIINSKDEAGNSYQSNVINNEYCSVWCKEDYHMILPGQKEANSGRYFSLKASISGTKTCYTNKTMKYDEFIRVLNEKREKVNSEYYRNSS